MDRMAADCWPPPPGWNPRMSMSISNTKGLLNAPGENNCFLNSAVQVLWHLDVFRRSFRVLSGHACMGNSCIFCALKVIFTQFQYSDNAALPSDSLRKALAKTFADQQRFQLGLMDDAAECFEKMLLRIHFHLSHPISEDSCSAQHCIPHQKFGMNITEQVACECGAVSADPFSFTQMVHYVSTSTLVSQLHQAQQQRNCSFGSVLRLASSDSSSELKTCPNNCGRQKVHVRRQLTSKPEVVSVGLIWDSDQPSLNHINDVLRAIGTSLNLSELYHSVPDCVRNSSTPLQLVGVVCYYGKHYSTFFFHSKSKTWLLFDDANVQELDPHWDSVVEKCSRGHFQPLLLLFAHPNSVPVSPETAHQNTFLLDSSQYSVAGLGSAQQGISHGRQRSFDRLSDGSGTIGGRVAPPQEQPIQQTPEPAPTKNARRAITPNPMKMADRSLSVSRRSMTPNPEWAMKCHSDDEDEKKPGHYRQPSYLHAFDTTQRSSKPMYSNPMAREQQFSGTNNSGLSVRNSHDEAVAIDLSGPVPKAAEYHHYHNNDMQMGHHANHPHAYPAQKPRIRTHSLGQELDEHRQHSDTDCGPRRQMPNDDYGTYISRKAVQSILQHQGIKARNQAQQMKDLNVDIPDNSSLNSESGYRSGNSACSTSSLESPNDASRNPIPPAKPQVHRKPAVPAKPSLKKAPNVPVKNAAEEMYLEAEHLMQLANENESDANLSLLHCNKAISLLQQAQTLPNADQDSVVRIRMKHNACVLRSRSIHKRLTQRQVSNQSSQSSDLGIEADHISLRSSDNEGHKVYTKQDSGYGGYSTDSSDCHYNVRRATQMHKANTSANQFAGISRSVTDSQISKCQRQESVDRLSRDIDTREHKIQSIDHIATLPRKGKSHVKKPDPEKERSVYQAYLQRQRSSDDTLSDAKQGLENARQWSKDDIRQMLVKDYYKRRPKDADMPPPPANQDMKAVNRSNSNLSYEEMIQRQMQSMALKQPQEPPIRRSSLGPVRVMPQTKTSYPQDFNMRRDECLLPQKTPQNHLSAHVEALNLAGSEMTLALSDPCPSVAKATNEPDTGNNPNNESLEEEAFPPPPSDLLNPPPQPMFDDEDLPPPPYPGLPSQPNIEVITVQPVWESSQCRCGRPGSEDKPRKPCSRCKVSRQGSNSSTSSWATDSSSSKPKVPPKLITFQQIDSGISSGSCSAHAPDSPTSTHRSRSRAHRHHKHRLRSRTCSPKSSRIPESPDPKPALSKKKKKGRKPRKSVTFSDNIALISTQEDKPPEIDYVKYVMDNFPSRRNERSNSFSSTSTGADCDTLSITRSDGASSRSSTDLSNSTKSSGQGQGYDSDLDLNSCSDDDTDIDESTADIVNKMRCVLCRKKWVCRDMQYCAGCGAYMSQFQPLKS